MVLQRKMTAQGTLDFLRKDLGDQFTTLMVGKLFHDGNEGKEVKENTEKFIRDIWENGFKEVLPEAPKIFCKIQDKETIIFLGENESAKRMIQIVNIQKNSPKGPIP